MPKRSQFYLAPHPLKDVKKIEGSKSENNLNTARHNMMKIFWISIPTFVSSIDLESA